MGRLKGPTSCIRSSLTAEISGIAEKFDLEFNYDFNRARALYSTSPAPSPIARCPRNHGRTTLPTPTALPSSRASCGVEPGRSRSTVPVVRRVLWYERYRVNDFTLDAEANPDLVRGQALLLGYLYRPYTTNTIWAPDDLCW